jgi:hypothetical protein
LFAGNFDFGSSQEPAGGDDAAGQDWSDFANFDDAFATVGAQPALNATEVARSTPPISDALAADTVGDEAQLADSSSQHSSSDLDELFGPGDHASLLALDEVKPDTTGVASPSAVAPSVSLVVQSDEPSSSPVEQDPAQDDVEILAAPSDELKADLSEQETPATMCVE